MTKPGEVIQAIRYFMTNLAQDPFLPKGRRLEYLKGWLQMNYSYAKRNPRIPVKAIHEIYPQARDVTITMEVRTNWWNISPTELYILCRIACINHPQRIFEFGTYDGATTYQLTHCIPSAEIFTIDLSPRLDLHFVVGSRFIGTAKEKCIHQLYGDSTKFDFSGFKNQMDFIFIDGGHEYEVVKSDTVNALNMIRPNGVVVWDDYVNWPGVKRAVEELVPQYPIIEIKDTKFAILMMERNKR